MLTGCPINKLEINYKSVKQDGSRSGPKLSWFANLYLCMSTVKIFTTSYILSANSGESLIKYIYVLQLW